MQPPACEAETLPMPSSVFDEVIPFSFGPLVDFKYF